MGAALSTLVTGFAVFFYYMYFSQKYYFVNYPIAKYLISLFGVISLYFYDYKLGDIVPSKLYSICFIITLLIFWFLQSTFFLGYERSQHYIRRLITNSNKFLS
jgi:hypothetical protein